MRTIKIKIYLFSLFRLFFFSGDRSRLLAFYTRVTIPSPVLSHVTPPPPPPPGIPPPTDSSSSSSDEDDDDDETFNVADSDEEGSSSSESDGSDENEDSSDGGPPALASSSDGESDKGAAAAARRVARLCRCCSFRVEEHRIWAAGRRIGSRLKTQMGTTATDELQLRNQLLFSHGIFFVRSKQELHNPSLNLGKAG